jgi:ABC-type cobalamin/Fe3+-siderophores transport system ATPase subunit
MVIKRLDLKMFGKFTDKSFDLHPVTVFYGPNESGKTTIFDALHKGLANPAKTTKAGKRIKERYQQRDDAVVTTIEAAQFDNDAFLNLHAIRTSDLLLELSDKAEWMQSIKARLFSGGINPEILLKRLEDLGSTMGNRIHMRELAQLEAKLAEFNAALEKKLQVRSTILARHALLHSMGSDLADVTAQKQKLNEAVSALEKELLLEEKLQKRLTHENELKRFYKLRDLKEQLRVYKDYATHDSVQLEALFAETARLTADLRVERAKQDTVKSQMTHIQKQVEDEVQALEEKKFVVELAVKLIGRLDELTRNPPSKKVGKWDPYTLVFTCLVISVTAIVAINSPLTNFINLKNEYRPYGVGVGSVLAVVFLLLSYRRVWEKDEDKRQSELSKIRNEWAPQSTTPVGESEISLRDSMQISTKADVVHVEALTKLKASLSTLTAQAEILERSIEKLAVTIHEIEQQIAAALRSKNASDFNVYKQSVLAYQQLNTQIHGSFSDLPMDDDQINENIRDLDRRLNYMDEEGIVGPSSGEGEVTRLKQALIEHRLKLDAATKAEALAAATQARASGEMEGEFRHLPKQLLDIEREIVHTKEQIEKNKIQREAATLAAQLFRQISEDNQSRFRLLAVEVEKIIASSSSLARVEISKLALGDIKVSDATGEMRPLEQLSTGTRDLFLLASRLVLLGNSGGPRLLILDEPFVALDSNRVDLALGILEAFQKSTKNSQLIFLTKEKTLLERIKRRFEDSLVIDLN